MDPERWRRVRTLFDELVELDPGEREGRLTEIGAANPELRDELASLLAADERSSGGMRRSTLRERVFPTGYPSGDWLGLAGSQISHFRVLEPLGAGGMGVVYRAEDTRLNRPVALKFPLPHTRLDPNARARFLREARAVAALDHPNLCTIYDVGESPDGYLFIAMALYEGETLAARLARESFLSVEETVTIARQIAAGVARAHAAGVVHRDLKPANIMLTVDKEVRLLDFGLAKSDELSLSLPGAALGTPPYMAPEQLSGETVDERTDLWAVGVIIYEMLTGQRPFQGSPYAATGLSVRTHVPIAPFTLRPEVPPALNSCVLRLLEKDPELRYRSANELLNDLSPVDRRDSALGERRARSTAGHRSTVFVSQRLAALAVGVVGVLTAAVVLYMSRSPAPAPPPSIAVLPFINFSPGPESDPIAAGLHDDVMTQLAKVRGLRVASRGAVARYANGEQPHDRVARALDVSVLLEGSVQRTANAVRVNIRLIDPTSRALVWAETYDPDADGLLTLHREIAATVAARLGVPLSPEEQQAIARLRTDDARALEAYWQGRFHSNQLTPADLQIALDAFDRSLLLDSTFAPAWAGKAEACVWAVIALVLPDLEPCTTAAETALELDDQLAEAHAALAQARMLRWEWAPSEAGFLQALDLDPASDVARQGYGQLLRMLERPEEAMAQFQRAAEESPDNLYARTQVGWALFDQQRYGEALAQWNDVISRDPTFWLAVYNKGLVYALLRDSVRLRETIERVEQLTMEGSPHVGSLHGLNLAIRGDRAGALAVIEEVCGGPESVKCLVPRAGVLHALGEHDGALSLLERAAELRDPLLPNVLSEPWFDDLGDQRRLVALRRQIGVDRR